VEEESVKQSAADWFGQLLSGLKAAHQAGVAHRELKPENVLVVEREANPELIKILDFGLAKMRLFEGGETLCRGSDVYVEQLGLSAGRRPGSRGAE
jgi:serine/threonine protein kinase